MRFIIPCKRCGQKNRMPEDIGNSTVRKIRCAACHGYEFTDLDFMEASIASNLGGLGVSGVEWADEHGNKVGGFDFKGFSNG